MTHFEFIRILLVYSINNYEACWL